MKFAIMGAGNVGYAISAYLSYKGADVFLYTRQPEKAQTINKIGISTTGSIEGTYKVECVTDPAEAINGSDCIIVTTTANAHKDILTKIAPFLENNQKILMTNANWGAFEAKQILYKEIQDKNLYVAETSSQLCVASSKEIGSVNFSLKLGILLAALEKNKSKLFIDMLKPYFPSISVGKNILMTTLCSTNPVIHVPITILNAVRTENGEPYKFYGNGISPLVIRYIEKMDMERVNVAKALNIEIQSVLDGINSFWEIKYDNLFDALRKNKVYQKSTGPKDLNYRYISEDIPYGIAPVYKMGQLLGVATPYTETLVRFSSLLMGKDFMTEGVKFNLEELKLALN